MIIIFPGDQAIYILIDDTMTDSQCLRIAVTNRNTMYAVQRAMLLTFRSPHTRTPTLTNELYLDVMRTSLLMMFVIGKCNIYSNSTFLNLSRTLTFNSSILAPY